MSKQSEDGDQPSESSSERLERGVAELRVREPSADIERLLVRLGMALPIIGLVIIALAWYGASGTGYVADQIPYLISGGVAGLGLVLIGLGLFLRFSVTHLIRFGVARMVHEQQAQADRIVEAMASLESALGGGGGVSAPTVVPTAGSHSAPAGTPVSTTTTN